MRATKRKEEYISPKSRKIQLDLEGMIAESSIERLMFNNEKIDDPQLSNKKSQGGIWDGMD